MIPHISKQLSVYNKRLLEVEQELKEFDTYHDDVDSAVYLRNSLNHTNPFIRKTNEKIIDAISRRDALIMTIKRLRSYIFIKRQIHVEADCEMSDMMDNKDTLVHENLEDTAGASVDSVDYGYPETVTTGQDNLLYLSDFLSRPLKLSQSVISLDTDFTFSLDIWDEFTSHPSVRAKLRNYAYLNATLNVRITVSGTPWHYGKLQVSYQPLAAYNANLNILDPMLSTASRFAALTYLSQAKGCTVIDVHDNKPLELECPYISPNPMLRLFNKSPLVLAAAGSYTDTVGFGTLYINSISPPKAISATATEIGLQVYAWMTDVQLGAPTGTVIEIGTESSFELLDERKAGPVQRYSSKAAQVAQMLSGVPIIGRFADAAIRPLTMLSKVSALFGFSYPTMIEKPDRVKNDPYQNASQCIGYGTGQRLTYDPKQELSVDPRSTGTDIDELALNYLCAVESLLDTFSWSSADGQLAGSIWMAPVNPAAGKRIEVLPGQYIVAPTALAFASSPFSWWRGEITYRFEIVCSKFHRGTLAVVYEPNISQNVIIDTVLDLNKQYIKKIDLQSVTDFEVTVKWAYPKPWAKVMSYDYQADMGDIGFLGSDYFDIANGYIAVVPYTELQSPDGSEITINVYVRSDNMHLNQFSMVLAPPVRPSVESDFEMHTPNIVDSSVLNQSSARDDNITVFNFGEEPTSFRTLLKRFETWHDPAYNGITANVAGTTHYYYQSRSFGNPSPSYSSYPDNVQNLFGYLRYAYLGMRGGIKHRFNIVGPNGCFQEIGQPTSVRLEMPAIYGANPVFVTSTGVEGINSSLGSTTFVQSTNAGIEFEVPMYTPDLFLISFRENPLATSSLVTSEISSTFVINTYQRCETHAADDPAYALLSSAAAEDFSFMRYSGAPIYSY